MLEPENAVHQAVDKAEVAASAENLEYLERPSCPSRPDGLLPSLRHPRAEKG
jgi:hypothetical protein